MNMFCLLFGLGLVTIAQSGEFSNPNGLVKNGLFVLSKDDICRMTKYISAMKTYPIESKAPQGIKDTLNKVKGHGTYFQQHVYPRTINQGKYVIAHSARLLAALSKMEKLSAKDLDSSAYTLGQLAQRKPQWKAVVNDLKSLQSLANAFLAQSNVVFVLLQRFVSTLNQDKKDLAYIETQEITVLAKGFLRKRDIQLTEEDAKSILEDREKRFLFGVDKLIREKVVKPVVKWIISDVLKLAITRSKVTVKKMRIDVNCLKTGIQHVLPSIQKMQSVWAAIRDDIQGLIDFRPVDAADPNANVFPFQVSIAKQLWAEVRQKSVEYVNSASPANTNKCKVNC